MIKIVPILSQGRFCANPFYTFCIYDVVDTTDSLDTTDNVNGYFFLINLNNFQQMQENINNIIIDDIERIKISKKCF